jgi:hypothetical protein
MSALDAPAATVAELRPEPPKGRTNGNPQPYPDVAPVRAPEPWSEIGERRLRSALATIPADDRDIWLKIGFALHDLTAADPRWPGREMWDEWSKTCPDKFDPAGQDKTWASFDRGYQGPRITVATIFHMAKEAGRTHPTRGERSRDDDTGSSGRQSRRHFDLNRPKRSRTFLRTDGTAYADVEVGGHRETAKAPNSEAFQSALAVIEARAQFKGQQRDVCVRVGGFDGKLYLDLCDPEWRGVEIDSAGWRVVGRTPVRFRRAAGMKPLATPERGGAISELRRFLNVASDGDFLLVVAWLLAGLRDRGPYPMIALSGEQGSAKSTAWRHVARAARSERCAAEIVSARRSGSLHRRKQWSRPRFR